MSIASVRKVVFTARSHIAVVTNLRMNIYVDKATLFFARIGHTIRNSNSTSQPGGGESARK